eukprot:TRINITY_DN1106_c0_g1_i1.p2 TRINITY_DN1106_c0_g1~~TRINITY_DN1106_c0_g1_i1.p2  ORF type:complete len:297 (+),score=59.14 TRINITY_DN1106_c0_g1_i1:48-938(+)
MSSVKNVLVIGALGHEQGTAVIKKILEIAPSDFKIFAHTKYTSDYEYALSKKQGIIQWVDLNLKEGDKLVTDFKALGIEYVFFSHSVPAYSWKKEDELQEAMNIIYAAKRSDVRHVVYGSVYAADKKAGVPEFEIKTQVEDLLKDSYLPYTILRPAFFMENFLNDFFPGTIQHLEKGVLRQPLRPHDTIAVFSKDDLGAFAVMIFKNPLPFINKCYELVSEQMTMKEYAKLLKCTYEQIPFDDVGEQRILDIYRWFQIAPQEQFVGDPKALREVYPITSFNFWVSRHHLNLKKQEA